MKEYVMFSFLPSTKEITNNRINSLVESNNKISEENKNYDIYQKIIWYLTYRLANNENKEYCFTEEEYSKFRHAYAKVEIEKEEFLLSSILICLKTPNSKILEELNRFSKIVDWYPESIKIKNNETNGYTYQKKEIEVMDCFYLSIRIMNRIYQFIHNYSANITKKFKSPKDVKLSLEKYSTDSFYKNMYLSFLDNEFYYLKDFPLFESIYENVREQALKLLLYKIKTYYSFDEIEYGFGNNIYHRNELAWLIEKRDKNAARKKRSRR